METGFPIMLHAKSKNEGPILSQSKTKRPYHDTLFGDLSGHDWRLDFVHMVFVTKKAVLTRHVLAVARRALLLFNRFEIRHKDFRIMGLISGLISWSGTEVMTCQAALFAKKAEMRFVGE